MWIGFIQASKVLYIHTVHSQVGDCLLTVKLTHPTLLVRAIEQFDGLLL